MFRNLKFDPTAEGAGDGVGTPPPASLPAKVTLKVNGLEEEVTLEEAIARAQKISAADKYLSDASRTASDNKMRVALGDDVLKAVNGDIDALHRVGAALNYKPEDVNAMLAPKGAGAAAAAAQPAFDPNKFDWSQIPGFREIAAAGLDVGSFMNEVKEQVLARKRGSIDEDVKSAIGAHPTISQYFTSPEVRSTLTRMVDASLQRQYTESGGRINYRDNGPQMIAAALKEVTETAKVLGLQTRSDQTAASLGLPPTATGSFGGSSANNRKPFSVFETVKDGAVDPFMQRLAIIAHEKASAEGGT